MTARRRFRRADVPCGHGRRSSSRLFRAARGAALVAALAALLGAVAALAGAEAYAQEGERFVSLKAERANLRVGPGRRYPIEWVYTRPGLPLLVIANFDQWRWVRDHEGTKGWMHKSLLSAHRTVLIMEGVQTVHERPLSGSPAVLRASRLLHEGAIGAPQALHLKLRCNWAGYEGPNLSLAHHLGPWYMDALNTIIGRPPERVLVMDGTGRPGLRQFHTLVQLDYSGLWGTLQLNINSLDALETTIEATGDDGDMVIDYFKNTIHLRSRSNPDGECIDVHTDGPTVGGWPGERESIVDFLNAVESGGPNRTHGSMAAEIYLAGLAAETSRSAGDWETVGSL